MMCNVSSFSTWIWKMWNFLMKWNRIKWNVRQASVDALHIFGVSHTLKVKASRDGFTKQIFLRSWENAYVSADSLRCVLRPRPLFPFILAAALWIPYWVDLSLCNLQSSHKQVSAEEWASVCVSAHESGWSETEAKRGSETAHTRIPSRMRTE